jgi:ubiquinone/menaquinone biosynthesis C-methylase UbiE
MNIDELQAYHRHIAGTYDERSGNHDKSEWHRKTALKLVGDLPPRNGDNVLDIGTGTGTIAFKAASLTGSNGKVVGVDISNGMLKQAKEKLDNSDLHNIEFILSDAENLAFPPGSFDRIYCASAFFCILDPLAALKHWYNLLTPGGGLGFHALPETSYVWVSVARRVLKDYGISYELNTPTGTMDKCRQLLKEAGFTKTDIREEKLGHYISLEQAKDGWLDTDSFLPGQYPNPLVGAPREIVSQAQQDYDAIIDSLNTDKGVWNDVSMYYVYGWK